MIYCKQFNYLSMRELKDKNERQGVGNHGI